MLTACQRELIYFPARSAEPELLSAAVQRGVTPWRDTQGQLIGWWRKASGKARGRLLVFHGNAGQAIDRVYFASGFANVGWDVYLFEYPGYGARAGPPGEARIKAAARDALAVLQASDPAPVVLVGESLGGGVACALGGDTPHAVAALVLITPFSSLVDVARHHYPRLLVDWLLRERYDCMAPLERFRGPLAVLLAGQDEIIPQSLGRRLHDHYRGPKRLWIEPSAGHNTIEYRDDWPWWNQVAEFLPRDDE